MKQSQSYPIISILMSVWNASEYLCDAIDSILNQTLRNFEFIIVDDCSTDDSADIIQDYANQDERIVFISNKENLGLSASLNRGLKLAKGEFVARMDPDDIALPYRLEVQYEYLKAKPEVFVVGTQAVNIDKDGNDLFYTNAQLNESEIYRIL